MNEDIVYRIWLFAPDHREKYSKVMDELMRYWLVKKFVMDMEEVLSQCHFLLEELED